MITDSSISSPPSRAASTANSVEIPISFAPTTSGCANGSVVTTESEFGIDVLMPLLARLSCQSDPSTAIVPIETASDGLGAVTDLATGSFPPNIAFTDDPEAADQQAHLMSGSFALIPVALTANVVSFFDQLFTPASGLNAAAFYPVDQMDLTPTMVAGLLTHQYGSAPTVEPPPVPCSGPSLGSNGNCLGPAGPCFGTPTCSLYSQLNFVNGFNQFQSDDAVQRSDNAGVTDQLFTWLCNAPIKAIVLGTNPTVTETETVSGASVLESGLAATPLTSCPSGVDQVPPYGGTSPFITANDPNQQALKTYTEVFNSGVTTASQAGFADMNWAEARYYGMSVASLQNATGAFVAPTAASLDAAVNDATVNQDGSLTPVNSTTDAAAYPMPSIVYAVVNTAPVSQSQATADTTFLTQLLDLTGGTTAGDLPQGFVPLPPALATQARTDVAKDITVTPVTTPPGSPSPSPSPSGSGSPGSTTGGSASPSTDTGFSTSGQFGIIGRGRHQLLERIGHHGALAPRGGRGRRHQRSLGQRHPASPAAAAGPGAAGLCPGGQPRQCGRGGGPRLRDLHATRRCHSHEHGDALAAPPQTRPRPRELPPVTRARHRRRAWASSRRRDHRKSPGRREGRRADRDGG